MTTIIFCLIYLLSAFGYWKGVNISHNKYGRWELLCTTNVELIVVFIPVVNTMWFILDIFSGNFKQKDKTYLDRIPKEYSKYDKFFRIKN